MLYLLSISLPPFNVFIYSFFHSLRLCVCFLWSLLFPFLFVSIFHLIHPSNRCFCSAIGFVFFAMFFFCLCMYLCNWVVVSHSIVLFCFCFILVKGLSKQPFFYFVKLFPILCSFHMPSVDQLRFRNISFR